MNLYIDLASPMSGWRRISMELGVLGAVKYNLREVR